MNTVTAKQIIKKELDARGLKYDKLTAKAVDFSDLGRESCIFVKVHGWEPNPVWDELKAVAVANGFRIRS